MSLMSRSFNIYYLEMLNDLAQVCSQYLLHTWSLTLGEQTLHMLIQYFYFALGSS